MIGVPAGRYVITDIVTIEELGHGPQGAGARPLGALLPGPAGEDPAQPRRTTGGRPTSNYSWSGGFVEIRGRPRSRLLARVVAPAERGPWSWRSIPTRPAGSRSATTSGWCSATRATTR